MFFHIFCTLIEVDECESQPCQNGGDCTNKVGFFECNCTAGYEGVQCETGSFSQLFFFQILSSKEMGGTTVSFFSSTGLSYYLNRT